MTLKASPESRRVRVFISYSHDSEAHETRVRQLAERLVREDGIDCELDKWAPHPSQGWPRWMDRQIDEADFVLVVCTDTYYRAIGREAGRGRGVRFESALMVQAIYDADMRNEKFIPVLFADSSPSAVIKPLRGMTRYQVDTQDGYDGLLRHLTSQPRYLKPDLGPPRILPPEQGDEYTNAEERASTSLVERPRFVASHISTVWIAIIIGLSVTATCFSGLPSRLPIFAENSETVASDVLLGEILDAQTGEPLEGVLILLPEFDLEYTTGPNGRYEFEVPVRGSRRVKLRGLKSGYESLNVDPTIGLGHLDTFKMRKRP
jgi:hypothetical protein